MFCPHCGKQSAPGANFCSTCGVAALPQQDPYAQNSNRFQTRIVRPRHPRMLAGVCSGLAIHYGWDIGLVRILFAVSAVLTSGIGILFYLAAWIIFPDALYALPPVRAAAPPAPNMNPTSAT